MKILALDTATEACSAALYLDGQVLPRFERAGRSHTKLLLPMVQALLAEGGCRFGQLDGIVCGVGPGSFAGVRIAVSYVKGLALAIDRPVFGVSSLAMLAQAALNRGAAQVLAAIDARMNEVYVGRFGRAADGRAVALQAAVVCAPDAVPSAGPGPWTAVGTGWGTYEAALRQATGAELAALDGAALPSAEEALQIALPEFAAGHFFAADRLEPDYLRNKVALTLAEQGQLKDNARRSAPALRDGKP
jgi:tRNA threonylcarbamoyladenosine biosynthesis protein TsaB